MRPAAGLLAARGHPGFFKRSLDEFKRLSNIAIRLEALSSETKPLQLWDFSTPTSIEACADMSDSDIGGYSEARLEFMPSTHIVPAHARFFGNISNRLPIQAGEVERTGYAAWRTEDRPPTVFGRSLWDVDRFNYLALRIKSDGRKYKVNIQTESLVYTDLHQHRLYARFPGQWETVFIRWADFVRTNHGVVVEPQSEMMREKVRTIGVGLTDRRAGTFELCVNKIWATNDLQDELGERQERVSSPMDFEEDLQKQNEDRRP